MNELTFSQRLVARILLACLLFFIVISFLLQHLSNWFYGRSSGLEWPHTLNVREITVAPIRNPCVLTRFTRSPNSTSGYPLVLETSVKSDTKCYILYDINVEEFHRALLTDADGLIQFFRVYSKKEFELKIGKNIIQVEQFSHRLGSIHPDLKRTMYPVVVGFVSDYCDYSREQIVLCCYVIHIRLQTQETIDTGVMYTFWKTNWSRLLTPQAIYASRDNTTSSLPAENGDAVNLLPDWTPSCFICLSEVKGELRVLLPCRHAGLCLDCFKEFRDRTTVRSLNPLSGLICPLCRTTITAILKVTSCEAGGGVNVGNVQID